MNRSYFKNQRVLVAGASGFIGHWLCQKLSGMGAVVRGTYHKNKPSEIIKGVEYINADLTSHEQCKIASSGIDIVIMAAANRSGAGVMQNSPLAHLTPNVLMNTLLLAAAYENKVKKFCFISSNTVYPVTDSAVTEECVNNKFFHKYEIVGGMKLFSESMCRMYSNNVSPSMSTIIIRPGNLYGPHDKFNRKESKVIAALIRRSLEKQNPFQVWGDGEDIKDFLYVEDFVEGLLEAVSAGDHFNIYNIAAGNPISIKEALDIILNKAGHGSAKVEFDLTKPTMIPKRLIDIEKIKTNTSWRPTIDFETGIERTVAWYRTYFEEFSPEEKK